MPPIEQPSWRKPFGILAILAYVSVWVVLIASASAWIGARHWALQTGIYLVAGIIWILPLGPWLKWIETGRFR
jgi:Protein of unknown function (DUF2842)